MVAGIRDPSGGRMTRLHDGLKGSVYATEMSNMPRRISVHTRARVARLLREGRSYRQIDRETGVSKSTIVRWMKDPQFLALLHGRGVLTLGHVQVRTAEGDVLQQAPSEESWVWLGDGTSRPHA